MNRPSFNRLVALCLALLFAFSGLVSTACTSGGTPTEPEIEPEPIRNDVVRVISTSADSIEVEGVDPGIGGSFRLRIEGMRSERPVYYVNGVLAGDLFGNGGSPSATQQTSKWQGDDRRVSAAVVLPALIAALAAWSVVQFVDACATQIFFAYQDGTLTPLTFGNCVATVASGIAGKLGGTVLSKCGCIGRIKDGIYAAVNRAITTRTLNAWINQKAFKFAADVVAELNQSHFSNLYVEVVKELQALFTEYPPNTGPDPDPTPTPNPPPVPMPTPDPDPNPPPTSGSNAWAGSFTAVGTWQIQTGCFWRYSEEYTNVKLGINASGAGALTALVRVTWGPKIAGPANCPSNTNSSEMTLAFNVSATGGPGGWEFERVPDGLGGSSRSFAGTATPASATGTFSIRTSTIEANVAFTLNRWP